MPFVREMESTDFYDRLTPLYHLIYPDWEASITKQASDLNSIIKEYWGDSVKSILDVACGVGTQSLGLASLGYAVTASDLSSSAVARARKEAEARKLRIDFSVADMREAYTHHRMQVDLVIACDNAVPHLLRDDDLLGGFRQFYQCAEPGGGCLISVRDYEKEERAGVQVKPYGLRVEGETRYLVFQVWEFHGSIYDLSMYFVEDRGEADCVTHVMRTKYYAVGADKLMSLMTDAGFSDVQRMDGRFFQPVIIGRR
ncbi:MAG: class I SAM-dependent methyltransferase [Acidobacteriota bacterium]|nr:class I SAM-dependent methyltransferase [Acidobacteriota bacterium]